jgi:arylsulfatase A-like enzyme
MKNTLRLLSICALGWFSQTQAATAEKTNIIVILVDDMGFSDLSSYGSEIPTPNIDALAETGVKFRRFYNSARCCPTRASLITGLHPHQAGIGRMGGDAGEKFPGYRGCLQDRAVTIPEVLKPAGYYCAQAGKWHMDIRKTGPMVRGFDRALTSGVGGHYFSEDPGWKGELSLDGKPVMPGEKEVPAKFYSSDLWTQFSLKCIDEAKTAQKPFFIYLAENAPHFPLQAPAEDIAKFRGKYKVGWDALRTDRLARQKQIGLIPEPVSLTPRHADVPAWDSLSEAEKDKNDLIMAIYAATLTRLDKAIGDLTAGLKQRGVFDNTLIFFVSDNGACGEFTANPPVKGKNPGDFQSSVHLGQAWATLGSTPFSKYKHFTHEGGIATPLLISWPAGIPAEKRNQWVDTVGQLPDIMATCVEVSGASYPTQHANTDIIPMQGKSLVAAFADAKHLRGAPLYFEHEGNSAMRDGDWKVVRTHACPWELYNLAEDPAELNNLASAQPERLNTMIAAYQKWADAAFVAKWPGNNPPRSDGIPEYSNVNGTLKEMIHGGNNKKGKGRKKH